jgi:hypothetical protein
MDIEYLTEKEAAAFLKKSRRTMQNWRLDHSKTGRNNGPDYTKTKAGSILYTRAALIEWAEGGSQEAENREK